MKLTIFYFLFFTHLCQAEFEKVSTPKKYLTLGIIQTLILDEIRDVKMNRSNSTLFVQVRNFDLIHYIKILHQNLGHSVTWYLV